MVGTEGWKIFKLQGFYLAGNDVMNNKFLMILHNLFQYFNYLFFFHIDIKTIIIKIIVGKSLGAEPPPSPVCYGPASTI